MQRITNILNAMLLTVIERVRQRRLPIVKSSRTATHPATGTRRLQTGLRALSNHITLKLSKRTKHVKDHFATGRYGVHSLLQAFKINSFSFKGRKRNPNYRPWMGTDQHAVDVAWRVIKDWVEAQLALIETNQVKIEQVFLPYAITSQGNTLYE